MENKKKRVSSLQRPWTKYEIVIACMGIMMILWAVAATSYSFFSATIVGNDDATPTNVTTGKLDVNFVANEYFNNPNMMLVKDENRATEAEAINFSVALTPTSNVSGKYIIYLTDIAISNNFKSADLKYELLKNNTVLSSGNFLAIGTATQMQMHASPIPITPTQTDNFVLRVWLSETNLDQSSLYNGNFTSKVSVELSAD